MGEKTGRRILMMLVGIFFISVCVGCYRLSGFGVDAFTCMNLGISGFLDMQFGTWQLIMNGVRPGPLKASDVMRGNTSPVEMARSDTTPSFSPAESYTGRPSMLER